MKITILGAGISGLATGWKLSDEHEVLVIEKTPKIGGMASSFRYKDFILDYGPHKIYTQLPGILDEYKYLVKDDLMIISKKNQLMVEGKLLDFPIKFKQLITKLNPITSARCVLGKATGLIKKETDLSSYEGYLKSNFGKGIYETLFKNYASKVWGDPKELSEEIARRRIPVTGFADLIKNILFGAGKEQSAENFYYPKEGIGTVCDRIKERIIKNNGKIKVNTLVKSINVKNNRVESLHIEEERKKGIKRTDFLVSTIPIPVLLELINPKPPEYVFEAAKKLKYRSLILLYLIVKKPKVLDCNWIFFPDKEISINRLSEQKSFSPYTCPENKTALYAEMTCNYEDLKWKSSDKEIFDIVIKDLEKVNILKKEDVEEYFTRKARYVYPVYDKDFRKNLNIILDYLDTITNLQTTGRQGLFNYNNTDHCLDMANKTAEYIKRDLPREEWKKLRAYFDSYKIVD